MVTQYLLEPSLEELAARPIGEVSTVFIICGVSTAEQNQASVAE